MNFASDNWAGATEPVMAALARHQAGAVPSYGVDPISKSVTDRLSEIFEREVAVFFVGTGSAANALALSAYTKPGAVFFCHPDAHIQVDECGCPEFLTGGGKLVSVPGENGKMSPQALETAIAGFPRGCRPSRAGGRGVHYPGNRKRDRPQSRRDPGDQGGRGAREALHFTWMAPALLMHLFLSGVRRRT